MKSFADKINELNTQHVYPFHMPGHKRRMELINPYDIDITEIDGYDNLHNPEGMIKQLEDRISGMYDEKHEFIEKSYVLVNGSTCGILSAISAVTQYGDRILMARNSHKSAYNAVYIRGLEADYIYPEYIKWLGMNAAIEPDRLRNILTCIKADHGTENENHGKSRCSYKFERKTFKLLIGGSTASNACSMQGYKKMENNIIKISHLHKSFGEVKAVNDLSFQVKKGELFAFLGVNGAGKSTTISIICGQLKKDSGTVQINENDIEKAGKKVGRTLGVVFQDSVLDKPLTVRENLKSRAALYGITGKAFEERLKELVDILDFGDYLNRTVGKLSGGQRRRIDIARALLHRPEVLILDEPTTGLDPQTRLLIWNVIDKLRTDEKLTVFLTTHYMEEAANADYVVILDKGSIAAEGTPFELKNKYVQDTMSIYGVTEAQIKSLGIEYEEIRDGYRVRVKNTSEATELIAAHQELFYDYEVTKGGMDDVFLAVTGKRLGGEN